ncbi:MAG TPA: hypothetical protein P5519_01960 [Spirochaetia bacterium]|nr:hypothetical protein [Spirochaetales bacterium]HPD80555.1 hypothetical protein [Spirochaetales bacterium]HQK35642.1 hypothetical protein [Spirochaetales bacterium]HRS64639.1 hypothetical protein [Spirochaetia bacterium]HRV28131.1 hypothetical protein [Spirochaetia bacterium]
MTEMSYEEASAALEKLYELFHETSNMVLIQEYAVAISDLLGTKGGFSKYLHGNGGELKTRQARLLSIFLHNIDLLLHRTWVNEVDESKKAEALEELSIFSAEMAQGDPAKALAHLITISDLLIHLLFGNAFEAVNYKEFLIRIDPQFALLYYFLELIRASYPSPAIDEHHYMLILILMYAFSCY